MFYFFNLFYTVVFSVAYMLFKLYIYNDTAFIMIPTYFIFISIVYCIYMFSFFFKLTTLREINCMQFIRFIVNKQRL